MKRLEDAFLGNKTSQRRQTSHGRYTNECHHTEFRCRLENSGQFTDISRATLVVNNAHNQEQGSLEQTVCQHHGHARHGCFLSAQTNHQGDEAELADGAVGENQFEIELPKGAPAANSMVASPSTTIMGCQYSVCAKPGPAVPRGKFQPSPLRLRGDMH